MPVAVVTDSTHYMPADLVAREGLHVVSLYVDQGGTLTKESELGGYDDFYDRLRAGAKLPTTSQPSIGDFLEVYEPLTASGHDIVSIHISGGISGTVESARQAAAELASGNGQRRIEVVDSLSACGGLGIACLAATAAARGGGDVQQTAVRARQAMDAFEMWFAVDTLEYLQRGGRIGRAQAWIGTALRVKPILTLAEGTLMPIERVRTARRAFERLLEYLRARHDDGADAWVVQHIQSPVEAERLTDAGREIMGCEPRFVSQIGPVIGTHAGPGLLGVGSVAPELLR